MHNLVDEIIDVHRKLTGQDMRQFNTPRTPELSMGCNKTNKLVKKTNYQKIAGRIIYLICKILPEANNAMQELKGFF